MKRLVRALARALTGVGWVLVLPVPPFEPGIVVPVPRPAADVPRVTLVDEPNPSCRSR
ncbi:hypothetical protein [Amycolatopsis vancoresmycina]|uniref:hypothetical protein n=1 Tax=Amycolatopsis vancoresmycina TaxID=208444 RepID=UPI0003A12252|nr:hypothetical protein [Amycolatopsis vancoresmycina]